MRLLIACLVVIAVGAIGVVGPGSASAGGGSVPPGDLGDVNCDNSTTSIDVALVLQLDGGLLPNLPCQSAGDVDYNSTVNSLDGAIILQTVAGLTTLPALVGINVATRLPISVGEQVVLDVQIANARHLGGYDFALTFPEGSLQFVSIAGEGSFFNQTERAVSCVDPVVNPASFGESCNTIGPPVCLGGPPGESGDGSLGRVTFTAMSSGTIEIGLLTNLVSDNISPCSDDGAPILVPHQDVGTDLTITP